MDVTPQLIEQIDFSEKFRGYDQDQVDDFLERVGATIAQLTRSLQDAEQRIADLESDLATAASAPPAAPVAVAPAPVTQASIDPELEAAQATRTLMMAQRTADAAIADARQEADHLVGEATRHADKVRLEAQAQADRLVGSARSSAEQLAANAVARAEDEYSGRRDAILAQIASLETTQSALSEGVSAIEDRLTEYRSSLGTIRDSIAGVLDHPDTMLREPLSMPPLDVASTPRVDVPGAGVSSHESTPDRVASADAADTAADSFAGAGSSPSMTQPAWDDERWADGFGSEMAHDAAPTTGVVSEVASPIGVAAESDTWSRVETEPASGGDPWGPGSWKQVVGDERSPDVVIPASSLHDPAFTEATASGSGQTDVGLSGAGYSDAAFGEPAFGDEGFGEPAFTETGFAAENPAEHGLDQFGSTPATAPSAAPQGQVFSEPAAAHQAPMIGQDRYTRDLDLAVNGDEDTDDAMTAFFEGDDVATSRRFGRRR